MVTKHFFKILFIFILMIALGMAGILIVGSLQDTTVEAEVSSPK